MTIDVQKHNAENLKSACPWIFDVVRKSPTVDDLRLNLTKLAHNAEFDAQDHTSPISEGALIRVRDCARTLFRILTRRSDKLANISVAQAIWDIERGTARPDLTPAFFAELLYLFLGLRAEGPRTSPADRFLTPTDSQGRQAAIERSGQLDVLSAAIQQRMARYPTGLESAEIERRRQRRKKILRVLAAAESDWSDWRWQVDNIVRDAASLSQLVGLSESERQAIAQATSQCLPFGVTPYYLSMMEELPDSGNDRGIRAQVFPPPSYLAGMARAGAPNAQCLDFMKESDTSPLDLITRRYPAICIFKPFNTCPQICVYCQRNWEIEAAMAPGAMAPDSDINRALAWIEAHPSINEVLLTGGDPLAMTDDQIETILERLLAIRSLERIRIGTRVLVTMPMRITEKLADLLARFRSPGRRQLAIVTHVEQAYELAPETVEAVERLRTRGIPVYNQLVYTFHVSRRFEACQLRRTLVLCGIDPYYTFCTKGKDETQDYRVPIARLLQEQKEEARLLPGLTRTDEVVYNVPGLGKNYLRARQHRDLISILPNGARVYEFHPWEKNITSHITTYVGEDVPILDYLLRLEQIGEDTNDYETVWYYY